MGTHLQTYVFAPDNKELAKLHAAQPAGQRPEPVANGWFLMEDASEVDAAEVSKSGLTAVSLMLVTTVPTIVIRAFRDGKVVRDAHWTHQTGWTFTGKALPFEDKKALAQWKKKVPRPSPDGYDIAHAFMGFPGHGPAPTLGLLLPRWIMQELDAEGQRQDRQRIWLLRTAWRIARPALRAGTDAPPALPIPAHVTERHQQEVQRFETSEPLLFTEVPEEAARLGVSTHWLMKQAWLMARQEVFRFPGVEDPAPPG